MNGVAFGEDGFCGPTSAATPPKGGTPTRCFLPAPYPVSRTPHPLSCPPYPESHHRLRLTRRQKIEFCVTWQKKTKSGPKT